MTYSKQPTGSTHLCGLSTASDGRACGWWTADEDRQDERDRRARERQRAAAWTAIRAARPGHMVKREQTRQRVTARINELFPAGTYAAGVREKRSERV
jgi:hypothetical protein